ncbi:germ cell nuclear acidic protein isoform X1 [Phyllopteryx taeniolatus]|uniref:germ cell nuclear acidic protein isoform X1 n=1 Tax=Phyllopteryx taeniolatus TaxID=161469 RepID=UPI002AD5443B|nr:germ cell nuclear acidic protein isoform X1 [Phyllopteryx taeniolatus]XP_061643330.1 germ cell nuclear acidic protein isoform X1 [Phyllopteryx taeniolatus]XP_061643331.1 germ cell nuclear acidic protein isoform X1 [Phyllopteryx taeniolatus]
MAEMMNDDTHKLFERVSKKMGWTGDDGLDIAEKKLINVIGKQRRGATSGDHFGDQSVSPVHYLSEEEDKENQHFNGNVYKNPVLTDSSDDEFDQLLVNWATPKTKCASKKPCSSVKTDSVFTVSSDDDDSGGFEKFLQRVKTPTKSKKVSESESEDSLTNFIVDDDLVQTKSSSKVPKKSNTLATQNKFRRPLSPSQCVSSVFISDSEDEDDNITSKTTWRTRRSKPNSLPKPNENNSVPCDQKYTPPSPYLLPVSFVFPRPSHRTATSPLSPKRTLSAPSKLENSSSSEEDFMSLLDRLRKKNTFTGAMCTPKTNKEFSEDPPVSLPIQQLAKPRSLGGKTLDAKTPGKSTTLKLTLSQTEPRNTSISRLALCKTPGCFLESLSNPASSYCHYFKQKKEELTSKLYQMYNSSVFDGKLPINMSVTWNKKMRQTAGYCITGQERGSGDRYARIELSEKVCDSADRLRDTLIHEMCHAATWLINGVRDGHGSIWKLYARKSTLVHPELPMVNRCHNYDIKYKFQYQCTGCQNTIGRHSKSLDTQKFVCARCTGKLVLLTSAKPRPPTPFAKFVKENYGSVRQQLAKQSHAEVMRKLSKDFASKNKLSDFQSSDL